MKLCLIVVTFVIAAIQASGVPVAAWGRFFFDITREIVQKFEIRDAIAFGCSAFGMFGFLVNLHPHLVTPAGLMGITVVMMYVIAHVAMLLMDKAETPN